MSVAGNTPQRRHLETHKLYTHAPAANTAAIITLAAPGAGLGWSVKCVGGGYGTSDPSTGKYLTVTVGGDAKYAIPVEAKGAAPINLEFVGDDNAAVVITLEAGGGTSVARVNCSAVAVPV